MHVSAIVNTLTRKKEILHSYEIIWFLIIAVSKFTGKVERYKIVSNSRSKSSCFQTYKRQLIITVFQTFL